MVRMGELATVRGAGGVLCTIGLGSCVGVALLDRVRRVAGLAHVVLPAADGRADPGGKFADTAVPALLRRVTASGGHRPRLEAVVVGGARMFPPRRGGPAVEIGDRNVAAVRQALDEAGIPVVDDDVGGSRGRTLRVHADGEVRVKRVGGVERRLTGAEAA